MFVPVKTTNTGRDIYIDPRKIEGFEIFNGDVHMQMVSGETWNISRQFSKIQDAVNYFENILRTKEFNTKLEELIEEK